MKNIIFVAFILLSTPAHAGFEEADASYYARHMKSCQHKALKKPWHIIGALAPTITDECCTASVDAARKAHGTFVDFDNLARAKANRMAADNQTPPEDLFKNGNDTCPEGQSKNRRPCPTTKHWCAP